jgi:hypothetical protein
MEYRLLIDLEVIEFLDRLPKRTRLRLLDQFRKIRAFPGNYSDYQEYDAVGRRVQICVVSGWAIHYWHDFADRHMKILALKPADK